MKTHSYSVLLKSTLFCAITALCTAAEEATEIELPTRIEDSLRRSTNIETLSHDIEKISYASCLPCHGEQAEGKRSILAPSLAGQTRWYLERQISNFQAGIRGIHQEDIQGAAMRAMSLLLLDDTVRDRVLDEIEAFPEPKPAPLETTHYNLESGQERYSISCALCHGEQAEGNEAEGAPRLNTLPAWYTARQLRNFQLGIRGSHSDDTFGKNMRPMAMVVYQENEILDVAAYIATLNQNDL
ncbi:c-type cytochrome [Coraliomargarita sp. W4R72]